MRKLMFIILFASASLFAQGTGDLLRDRITDTAQKYLGVPYVYGAESPLAFDCSGFVHYVYKSAASLDLPRNSKQQWAAGMPIKLSEALPGDVIVFDTTGAGGPSHVAIFLGDGKLIHAISDGPKTGVVISGLNDRYFGPRVIGYRLFLSPQASPAAAQEAAAKAAQEAVAKDAAAKAAREAQAAQEAAVRAAQEAQAAKAAQDAKAAQAAQAAATKAAQEAQAKAAQEAQARAAQEAAAKAARDAAAKAAQAQPAQPAVQAPAGPRIDQIGFDIPAEKVTYTDKIPAATGTGLAFTLRNATGEAGRFVVIFYKTAIDFSKSVEIHRELVNLPKDGALEIPPYVFTEPGIYKLIVKDNWNSQLMERIFKVVDLKK
jgi:cell wall-associated NlpC family hydrolase